MYTKNNPVVLLLSLLLFNSSCSTLQDQNSLKQQLDLDFQTSQEKKEMIIEYLLNENIDFSIELIELLAFHIHFIKSGGMLPTKSPENHKISKIVKRKKRCGNIWRDQIS